jgi:sulfur-oxidizing protein SoxZ
MAKALIKVPATATRGEAVEVRALYQHAMETGFRRDDVGRTVARHIVQTFVCTYNGDEVVRVDLHPAIAANPYFTFHLTARESGNVVFEWIDDRGARHVETARIVVR